jgi:hypothetical protein
MLTLATFAPQAAARIHDPVEMFTVFAPSPPVPTISRDPGTVRTGTARFSIALASPVTCVHVSDVKIITQTITCSAPSVSNKHGIDSS